MMRRVVRATVAALFLVIAVVIGTGAPTAQTGRATATAGERLATLDLRVQLLEDSKAIKRLQRAYGYYIDKGMGSRIGDLFSERPDASVELGGSGVYVGKARIGQYFSRIAKPLSESELNNHMILQGVVHVAPDGRTAKGRWRGWMQTGKYGESATWAEGPYENEYVKENGVWKLHKVHWYATVIAPYTPGWHKAPQPIPGPSTDFPPDRPPSEAYKSYPSAYLPKFHYPNPVTGPRPAVPTHVAPSAAPASREASWTQLQRIEARAARVQDVNEVENLQRSYGYYLDKMLWDQVADLFTDRATLEIGSSGVYVGKDRIRQYLLSLRGGRSGPLHGELYEHLQLQPIVTVAPDGLTAKGRWRTFIQTGTHGSGSGGTWGEGPYENEYVKEDGVWKISKLHWFATFMAPYEGGWLKASQQLVDDYSRGKNIQPDKPSSVKYRAYPGVHTPPFHYDRDVAAVRAPRVPRASTTGGAQELDAALARLDTAVERLEDADAIENLSGIYGFYVDKSMHDDVADLFAQDSVLEILGRGVFLGLPRVRQYMHNFGRVGPQDNSLFNHMHLQPLIHVAPDGKTARARSRLFVMFGVYPDRAQWGAGIYENQFVKEDGVWKFRHLHGFQTFYTNYEDGWAKVASPIFAPYDRLPPDRPQSVKYDPYPAAYVPPFHYKNPVSGR